MAGPELNKTANSQLKDQEVTFILTDKDNSEYIWSVKKRDEIKFYMLWPSQAE
jgi:hypothetical protein